MLRSPPVDGFRREFASAIRDALGTGAMLAEILRFRPGVHGTLVDLRRVPDHP